MVSTAMPRAKSSGGASSRPHLESSSGSVLTCTHGFCWGLFVLQSAAGTASYARSAEAITTASADGAVAEAAGDPRAAGVMPPAVAPGVAARVAFAVARAAAEARAAASDVGA